MFEFNLTVVGFGQKTPFVVLSLCLLFLLPPGRPIPVPTVPPPLSSFGHTMATAFLQVIAHSSLASQTMLFSEEGKREKPADFTWVVVVTLQKKKRTCFVAKGNEVKGFPGRDRQEGTANGKG